MKVLQTELPGVLLLRPEVHADHRGFVMESFNRAAFRAATGVAADFVQDNHSRSGHGVLRGLHYQLLQPQGKLVRTTRGAVFDVAVDLRQSSPTFRHWVGAELTEDNHLQMWIPPGFAHGFMVLSEVADVLYKVTAPYAPRDQHCVAWDDPDLGIAWPGGAPRLSEKDSSAPRLAEAALYP